MKDYIYWDLGDADTIRMSDKALANIMRALILLKGRLYDASISRHYTEEAKQNRNPVALRISLPEDAKTEFEDMTGYTLTKPPVVNTGAYITTSAVDFLPRVHGVID